MEMNSTSKLRTLLSVFIIGIIGITTQTSSRAERVDPVPLTIEVIDSVRRATNTGQPSVVGSKMMADIKQIEAEAEKEKKSAKNGKRKQGEASSRMKSLFATRAVEMQFTKDEVLRQFDNQSAKLRELGLGGRIGALEGQRSAFNARFAQLDEALKRADKAGKKDYEQELDNLATLSKTLSPKQGDPVLKPSDTPPHFSSGRRRPHEEPQRSSPPAYAVPKGGNRQASADVLNTHLFFLDGKLRLNQEAKFSASPIRLAMNDYAISGLDTSEPLGLDIAPQEIPRLWEADPNTQSFVLAAITPGASCQSAAADLDKQTPEAYVTPEIAALAQALNYSPVKIFEYVARNIRYEPYWGLLKGAQGTLVAGSGGATDQAALLIALMREAGFPARFVRGTVGFYNHGQNNPGLRWIGAKSFKAATDILIYNSNPTTREILDPTNTTGIGMEMGHIWAEVCVPYGNYRGTQADSSGYRWIPLDPSFKDNIYQQGITHNTAFDYTTYMATRSNVMPEEAYSAQVLAAIIHSPPNYSQNTTQDVPYTATQVNIQYDILPSSLPYTVVSYDAWELGMTAETSTLPDSHRYKLVAEVKDGANSLLLPTQSFWMSDIALKRLSLGWQGATTDDQTLLDAWKNQSLTTGAPCSAVSVRPELRLDGALVVAGTEGGVGLCSFNNQLAMRIEIGQAGHGGASSWVASEAQYTTIAAANVYALHAHAYQTSSRLLKERAERLLANVQSTATPNAPGDEILAEFLHINLLKWMRYSSDAAHEISGLDGAYPGIGLHLGLTSAQMKIDYVFDLPFAVHRTGYLIDVGEFSFFPIDLLSGDLSWKTFMLSGYSASAYESYVWQETAHLDAVSTVRGLQYAREKNIEILTLNAANWDVESSKLLSNADPTMDYSWASLSDLYWNHIYLDETVTIPRSLIQYGDWKGAVYVGERNVQFNQRADFIIERYSGAFTIGDLLRMGYWGEEQLADMGFDVSYLRRHSEYWDLLATYGTVNYLVNYGCMKDPWE